MRSIILSALLALPPALTACKDRPAEPESTPAAAETAPAEAPPAAEPPAETSKPLKLSSPKATKDTDAAALGTLPEGVGIPVGDKAPDFTVTGSDGEPVSLAGLTQKGPILLVFYRGGW